jgi:uncharacterized protein
VTVFIDTSIVMYAGGADHPNREPCRAVMGRVADGTLDAVTSAEVVQEILHRFTRGQRQIGSRMARSVLDLFDEVLPVERCTIAAAVARYENHPQLSARDALHVATCVANGINAIVSVDAGFDVVADVRRIDPRDLGDRVGI